MTPSKPSPIIVAGVVACLVMFVGIGLVGLLGLLELTQTPNTTPTAPAQNIAAPAPTESPAQRQARLVSAKKVQEEAARKRALEAKKLADAEKARKLKLARDKRDARRALAALVKHTDNVQDITWYRHPTSPDFVGSRSAMFLYFGKDKTDILALRLQIQYVSDDWLFIEKFIIKADDKTFTIVPTDDEMKRDNDSNIWEWYDQPADDIKMIQAIINSKKTILRYEGKQYFHDREISRQEKEAMRAVYAAYDAVFMRPEFLSK